MTPTELVSAAPALAGVDAALEHVVAGCLVDGPVGLVGLELEAHCVDLAEPSRRPDWARIGEAVATLGPLPGGSSVTVEPGGAVELSGPPLASDAAVAALAADRRAMTPVFAAAGLGLLLLGADPLRSPQRVNPGTRYAAMERFFAATGTADAGAAMMTSTASLQVNLDAGPRSGWADRVRLAHALGPVLVAVAGNSPWLAGRDTGWRSARQQVWSRLDEARCGPVLGRGDADPAQEWATYALNAPVMLVAPAAGAPGGAVAVTHRVPFAAWASGEVLLEGRRPTAVDLDYHLTTLFPPVRPRRWLEIRYLDAVPDALWPALVAMTTLLLDDPVAADVAAEATEGVADAWDVAARAGLADPALHTAARRCVAAAADRVSAPLRASTDRLAELVEQGRCPGDAFAADAARSGASSAVATMLRDETSEGER